MGVLDNHKDGASPLHCRSKPRQRSEDSSANLFRIRQAAIPSRIHRKTQQHGEWFDHIGTVQIEIAEKVSEVLAPCDVILFAGKIQRPFNCWITGQNALV